MQELTSFISNHSMLALAAAIVIILLFVVEFLRTKRNTININPTRATQMINHDQAVIIDIRPLENFKKGHIIGAHSLPSRDIQQTPKKLERFRTKPIIIVCNTGVESQKVATDLFRQGYNAYSLAGGMRSWSEASMPIIKE